MRDSVSALKQARHVGREVSVHRDNELCKLLGKPRLYLVPPERLTQVIRLETFDKRRGASSPLNIAASIRCNTVNYGEFCTVKASFGCMFLRSLKVVNVPVISVKVKYGCRWLVSAVKCL